MGRTRNKPPARTAKERENHLINLAMDFAERQLMDGTATSQVVTHFLKLGTIKEQLENDKLRADLDLANAKIKEIQANVMNEEGYARVLDALKTYKGLDEYD